MVFIKFVGNDISLDSNMLSITFMPTITLSISFCFYTDSQVLYGYWYLLRGRGLVFP